MPITATVSPPAFLYAPDFFKTNRIFTDRDQQFIRQHLDSAQANLLHVDELMQDDNDEERVQDLSQRKTELVDLIERCRVALAPIKDVPDDVLQYIFMRYCEDQYISRNWDGRFLITLCSVCSGWRSIALETPVLWSQVLLSNKRHFPLSRNNVSSMEVAVKLWFSRAGACPISLMVSGYGQSNAEKQELVFLAERIITLPSRYRRLSLTLPMEDMETLLGKLSPDQLRYVEVLRAIEDDIFVNYEDFNQPLPFSDSTTFTNLKSLTLSHFWNLNSLISVSPFPRLQKLHIELTTSLALELFQQSPLLEECWITIKRCESNSTVYLLFAARACYVTLPQLQLIDITVDEMVDCCILIDQLVLSSLQYFKVSSSHAESEPHSNELAACLAALYERSGTPNMHHLHINCIPFSKRNLGLLLKDLPHLETLIMNGTAIMDEETVDGLATGALAPRLGYIKADRVRPTEYTERKIARKRAQIGLPKLVVRSEHGLYRLF